VALANHGIQFPIAQPGAALHDSWPLLDGDAVRKVASTTIRPLAFAALALTPQMPVERPLGAFVVIHIVIDPFMTHRLLLARAQPATDLRRTPLFLEQVLDSVPGIHRNAPVDFGASPGQHQSVGLLGAIAPAALIPPDLAADGGRVNSHNRRYLLVPMPRFQQGLNLIALLQGQLCVVSHKRSSYWSVKEARMLPQLTS
jgi:hypothetical protein